MDAKGPWLRTMGMLRKGFAVQHRVSARDDAEITHTSSIISTNTTKEPAARIKLWIWKSRDSLKGFRPLQERAKRDGGESASDVQNGHDSTINPYSEPCMGP